LLLAGLFSGLAQINTAATRSFSHAITFGIDLAIFTNIVQYAYHRTLKTRKDKQPFCRKWGPFNCLLAATVLTMADLVRHLVNDAWGVAKEFQPGYEGFPHLSVYGWVFTIFCTWSGFILLFIGIFWLINIPAKMRNQWRIARGGGARTTARRAVEPEVEPSTQARSRPLIEGRQ